MNFSGGTMPSDTYSHIALNNQRPCRETGDATVASMIPSSNCLSPVGPPPVAIIGTVPSSPASFNAL